MSKIYDYVIVGTGIAGSSCAYFLKKTSNSILLLDKNSDISQSASSVAGAFLSPLLGKDNSFKTLVNEALYYSTEFYKKNFPKYINNCGTIRIPKNQEDKEKFKKYENFMDYPYEKKENGYFFKIASQVYPYEICKNMLENLEIKLNYEVKKIEKIENIWYINNSLKAKKIILTTGYENNLIEEKYFKIRAVWGVKIDINTSTNIYTNYHKECSLSSSVNQKVSIGATHRRIESNIFDKKMLNEDIKKLLKLANDIKKLENIEVLNSKYGARACSFDYFPIVGKLIDSKKCFEAFPHLKKGSHIKNRQLYKIDNLYVLNGLGGRGFVLAPYLAKKLSEQILENKTISEDISSHRLFKKWARRL